VLLNEYDDDDDDDDDEVMTFVLINALCLFVCMSVCLSARLFKKDFDAFLGGLKRALNF